MPFGRQRGIAGRTPGHGEAFLPRVFKQNELDPDLVRRLKDYMVRRVGLGRGQHHRGRAAQAPITMRADDG